MLMYWGLFIILFGVVVFIHELGHFSVAKLSGVRVERFALGFGPAILKKKWGETEYAICALPLGGYVKMQGEELDEASEESPTIDPRSYAAKGPWTRIAIVAMGPISNLILPVILFTGVYMIGSPTLTSKIGSVMAESPAAKAGILPGDRITKINGSEIWKWADLESTIQKRPGQETNITFEREGQVLTATLTPEYANEPDPFGIVKPVGKIGVMPNGFLPAVGIQKADSFAAKSGVQTSDVIRKVNNQSVSYFWQVEEMFSKTKGEKVLHFDRLDDSGVKVVKSFTVEFPSEITSLEGAGIFRGELFIRKIIANSVAEEKGLKPFDQIIAANGKPLLDWHAFQQIIGTNQGEELRLTVLRNGESIELEIIPKEITEKNELTRLKETRRQLGVVSAAISSDVDIQNERFLNPLVAMVKSIEKTGELIRLTVQGLSKLVTGQLAIEKSLGGPISIFYLAGDSYKRGGWLNFIQMMAMLSITLGIINILPIPVLDGGHLMFFLIEVFKGSPVSIRVREVAQQVGFFLLMGLIVLTLYVDFNRYFMDRIRALFNG